VLRTSMAWSSVISLVRSFFIFLLTIRRTLGSYWQNPWVPRNPSWKSLHSSWWTTGIMVQLADIPPPPQSTTVGLQCKCTFYLHWGVGGWVALGTEWPTLAVNKYLQCIAWVLGVLAFQNFTGQTLQH